MHPMIGVSQRVTVVADYQERRDTIDQRWAELLTHCGLIPIYLPNHPLTVTRMLESLPFDGFLLTGGNSLVHLGGDAPERDETERLILASAIATKRPLLGVCRGMQFIQHAFGVSLHTVSGHVAKNHEISNAATTRLVNSFHQFGATSTHPDLEITATTGDGVIESIRHRHLSIQGIMWHPERCSPFEPADCELLAEMFGSCLGRGTDEGNNSGCGARRAAKATD